ncbi:MAG: O-antigen ligase family protein, partial [Limisphaerales bacterium]
GVVIFGAGTVAVMGLALMEKVSRRRLAVTGALIVVAIVGLSFTLDSIMARFQDSYNTQSNLTRTHLNIASARMVSDYPLGVGWNNYGVMINHPYPYGKHIDEYERVVLGHNVDIYAPKGISESLYWLVLAENGYLGLIAFLAFLLVFYWRGLRNAWYYRRTFLGAVSVGIVMGFTLNYLQSFLERVLTQPRNMMLWFILLAAIARIHTWRKKKKKTFGPAVQEVPAPVRPVAPAAVTAR